MLIWRGDGFRFALPILPRASCLLPPASHALRAQPILLAPVFLSYLDACGLSAVMPAASLKYEDPTQIQPNNEVNAVPALIFE